MILVHAFSWFFGNICVQIVDLFITIFYDDMKNKYVQSNDFIKKKFRNIIETNKYFYRSRPLNTFFENIAIIMLLFLTGVIKLKSF